MSDIPEDILATTERILDWMSCRIEYSPDLSPFTNRIAGALMAERERCARIADDETGRFWRWGPNFNTRVAQRTCEDVAAAIRSPDKNQTP